MCRGDGAYVRDGESVYAVGRIQNVSLLCQMNIQVILGSKSQGMQRIKKGRTRKKKFQFPI